MKKLRISLALLLVLALFAGCTQETAEPTEDMEKPAETDATEEVVDEPVSTEPLQMLWWNDGIEGEVMQGILDTYEAETGVKIELVVLGWDDYSAKLKTMIRGGEAPALARATEGTIMEFNEFLVSLDGLYDSSDFTNIYTNKAGEIVSLPMDLTSNGMFFNKELFDKYEINYPTGDQVWTWAEFEAEMTKLEGKDDVTYPGVFDNKAHRFMPLVYQNGGKLWEEAFTVSGLTSPEAVEALTTLQRMNTNGTLDPAVWAGSAKPNELFSTGQYGFHMSGNWFVAGYQDLGFEWGVVPMPIGNGENATRSTILGGKAMVALADSGQEEEAKKFIEYLGKAEVHDLYTGGVPFLSPRISSSIDFGDYQAAYEVFQSEIANTPVENVADWQKQVEIAGMYPIINAAVEDAMGGKDVTEVLNQLAEDLIEKAAELGLE